MANRYKNGHVDDGSIIRGSVGKKCPNCNSDQYRETVSREHCPACGLECDYWGKGSNAVYDAMCERNHRLEEADREKRLREEFGDDDY